MPVVDAERAAALLHRLAGELAYLQARADGDRAALRADDERLSGLKYRFVTALETVVAVAQHVCSAQGWGPPVSNADSVRLLGREHVLDAALAQRVASAVGFGNLLVHAYADVDDDRVVAALDEVGDLEAFLTQLAGWLQAQGR